MSVIFDQLRISDDGKQLFINAHVNRAKYSGSDKSPFDDVFIEKVVVMDASEVTESLSFNSIPAGSYLYVKTFIDPTTAPYKPKEINLVLTENDFIRPANLSGNDSPCGSTSSNGLYFVFVQCNEEAKEFCLPCSVIGKVSVGVTFDENAFYQKVMNYTRELAEDCESIPKGFTDFILQWNAFKASVETEHFLPAIKFYNLMFGNGSSDKVYTSTKGCGCHGRSRL